jgi:hypothetical protein
MLCGLPRALLQVVHSNAVVWRNCQMRLRSTWRATVARTLSLEMVVLCGAKPQSCIPRLFRTGATSHRRRDRARWRRAFEGSPSPGCLESGSRTHTRPLIAELALMSHGPRMHLRFQGGSRGWRPGRRDLVLRSEIWKGRGPVCHVVVNASFHLVSPPARKLRQCGACWWRPQQVITPANRSYHGIGHTNVVSEDVCRDRRPCSVTSAANSWCEVLALECRF